MSQTILYPLRFEPIYQFRRWGGRRLTYLLSAPLPGDGPIGETWVPSDRADHPSRVAAGPLKGQTIVQVLERCPEQAMGKLTGRSRQFPLLLTFLDVREMLSVQVHPTDPKIAKTEACVILEAGTKSRIYAGLKSGATSEVMRHALKDGTVGEHLACFNPKPGDAVFNLAGMGHSLGGSVVVFEVQQNSDVTFRLYDWNHVDSKTGQPRPFQVNQALACIDFAGGAGGLVAPMVDETAPIRREKLIDCEYFRLSRVRGESSFTVGATGVPSVLVSIEGAGWIEHESATYET